MNLKKKAVALQYDPDNSSAPKVTAKGKGLTAEKIIELAEEHKIPIEEDTSLVQLLSQIELNKQIPPSLYQVVAEVLAMVYQLDKRVGQDEKESSKEIR